MMRCTVGIQAGGQSRRMGQNKALLCVAGKPLIQRVVERTAPLAAETLIISADAEPYAFLGLPVLADLIPGQGVLGGLYTALASAQSEFVACVACDMPFVNPALLRAELNLCIQTGVDVAIPRSENGLEPLHAVYRRETCLPLVRAALEAQQRRLVGWLDQARVRVLETAETAVYDPGGTAFINLNTPEDLARAEALAALEPGE